MRRECRKCFPRLPLQMKSLVSDPGMHSGTCLTHVPWCMSGKRSRYSRRMRNFTYLARGLWNKFIFKARLVKFRAINHIWKSYSEKMLQLGFHKTRLIHQMEWRPNSSANPQYVLLINNNLFSFNGISKIIRKIAIHYFFYPLFQFLFVPLSVFFSIFLPRPALIKNILIG